MISLRVESFKGRPPAEPLQATFGDGGGTIGRSESNQLHLPDAERHVSRIHAKLLCREGQYSIADQGSNPVLLNGRPIGHGMTAAIADGDLLAIGEYVIRVVSEAAAPQPAAAPPAPTPTPMAPPPAGSADPLGLFGGEAPPPAGGGAFDDLLGNQGGGAEAPPIPNPFDIPPPAAEPPPMAEPAPPPPPAAPSSGGGLFDNAPQGASAAIPDDFDPLSDPFAEPPKKEAPEELPGHLGLSDLGIAKDNYGESADVDSLFALDKGGQAPDPLAGSALGSTPEEPRGGSHDDPLVAFGGAAAPVAPAPVPDHVPEIKGAFNLPPGEHIPDETLTPGIVPPADAEPQAPEPATPAARIPDETLTPGAMPPVSPQPAAPTADAPAPAAPPAASPPPPPRPVPQTPPPEAAPAAPIESPPPAPEAPPVAEAPKPPPAPEPRPAEPPAPAPAAIPPTVPAGVTTPADSDALIAALRKGLGVADLPLSGPVTPEMMERIGSLLRESTQGTLDLLLARAMTKKEVKAEMTMIVGRGNNPLKFSPDVGMALGHLFGPPRKGFMSPPQAMRDAYDDLRSHQFGFMAGMRAALEGVLKRFTPDVLEQRLTRKTMIDSVLPMHRKAKLWDLYNDLYQEISNEAEDDFHALFGKEFLRAYDEQIARLEEAREADARDPKA